MAAKASITVTITEYRDTLSVTRYYKLVSATASAPSKPTANPPDGWTDTEPSYTSNSTDILYFCDLTVFSNGEWEYSTVSKSSSYEAAKGAYNKAQSASDAASAAQDIIDNVTKRLVLNPNSVDIVGDNGEIYASYGETTTIYGGSSSVNINGGGLDLKDDDGNVIFGVNKANDGASISESFSFTNIPLVGSSKTYTFAKTFSRKFKSISKIEFIGSAGTYGTDSIYSTNVSSGSVRFWFKLDSYTRADGTTVSWSLSGDTLNITIQQVWNEDEPTITADNVLINVYGTGTAEASIVFNGGQLDSLLEYNYDESLGWCYEKWASGRCELYRTITKTLALTTSSANAYSTSGNQTELLPFPLISGVAVGNAVDKYTEAVTCHVEDQNLIWRPFRHQSSSSASRTYAFIIKGRWK